MCYKKLSTMGLFCVLFFYLIYPQQNPELHNLNQKNRVAEEQKILHFSNSKLDKIESSSENPIDLLISLNTIKKALTEEKITHLQYDYTALLNRINRAQKTLEKNAITHAENLIKNINSKDDPQKNIQTIKQIQNFFQTTPFETITIETTKILPKITAAIKKIESAHPGSVIEYYKSLHKTVKNDKKGLLELKKNLKNAEKNQEFGTFIVYAQMFLNSIEKEINNA